MYKKVCQVFVITLAMVFTSIVYAAPEFNPYKYASPDPSKPYDKKVEQPVLKSQIVLPTVPEEYKEKAKKLTLMDLIEIALSSNPSTKYAWENARATAAKLGASRGAYYPTIDGAGSGIAGGNIPVSMGGRSYLDLGLSLNYLLFDFGGRRADVNRAKQALIAANLNHNQSIQDVLRDVPKAYYNYVGQKALVKANEASLREAETSLKAAEQRRSAGVATIADVLQSRANKQQAEYNLSNSKGEMMIARGNLARVSGWPANTDFETVEEMNSVPIQKIDEDINLLIDFAKKNRADLNAKIASVRQKQAEVKKALSEFLPKLSATGTYEWLRNRNIGNNYYYGGLTLQLPIFHGFSILSEYRKSKSELQAELYSLEAKEEGVISEVWNANANFRTSKEQLVFAKALLASAKESFDASSARYKAGAADIVELMTTQSQLANARAELITTQMEFYNNYAEIIHSIGAEFLVASPESNLVYSAEGKNIK